MKPFSSVEEAREYFRVLNLKQNYAGERSCLIQTRAGIRRVTFFGGGTLWGLQHAA